MELTAKATKKVTESDNEVTAHEEYQLLQDLAEIEKRILEQFGEEVRIIAPQLRRMNMYAHLDYMKEKMAEGFPYCDSAIQEVRFRLKKRELDKTSTAKERLLGWLGFNS